MKAKWCLGWLCCVVLFWFDSALAGVIWVPTGEFPTIQSAIYSALPGDVIRLAPGEYQENVVVDFSLEGVALEGGWDLEAARRSFDPSLTVIRAGKGSPGMALSAITVDAACGETISLKIKGLTIQQTSAAVGGGLSASAASGGAVELHLEGVRILENGAGYGGGLGLLSTGGTLDVDMVNVVLASNTAPPGGVSGGGMSCESRSTGTLDLSLNHVTVAGNTAAVSGGGIALIASGTSSMKVDIRNSVIWGNQSKKGPEIHMVEDPGASLTVNAAFSNLNTAGIAIDSGSFNSLGGSIDVVPGFVDPDTLDFRLRAESPCVDKGAGTNAPRLDFHGQARPAGPGVDMGADEFSEGPFLSMASLSPALEDTLFSYGGVIGTRLIIGDFVSTSFGISASRGFVSFDHEPFLDNARIHSAQLRLFQAGVTNTPYADLGNVVVDHLTFGEFLQAGDYGLTPLQGSVSVLSSSPDKGWKEAPVGGAVENDLHEGRGRSQFRLRFAPFEQDSDVADDRVEFETSANTFMLGNSPELQVVFSPRGNLELSVPGGQEGWVVPMAQDPVLDENPAFNIPLGHGGVTTGTLGLVLALPRWSGPVDVYLGIYSQSLGQDILLVLPDMTLSIAGQGLRPWKAGQLDPLEEPLFGEIPTDQLPMGEYFVHVLVTPEGDLEHFFLWSCTFQIP